MFFDRRYYLILGVGHEDADNPHIHSWHTIVTMFVHGGGFPGTTAHLLINLTYLVIAGGILERSLGSGRFFALSFACMIASWTLQIALDLHGHGISAVVWSYVAFAPLLLAHGFRAQRWRILKDPVRWIVLAIFLTGLIGLIKKWHLLAILIGIPFAIAWRGTLRQNLERIARGEPPLEWSGTARSLGIAVPFALTAFTLAATLLAVLGYLR
jgi:membrane associated rhomboid family serine protease